jgi:hypothetical protein
VRGKGLVIVTGCGHAGAVNIVRHAQRLTGVPRLHALLGGLHLGGAFFTPSIGPTVHALTELAPDLLVPGHCTGWRAQHTLAAALPDSWVQGSSGTRYQLTASLPRLTWRLLTAEAETPASPRASRRLLEQPVTSVSRGPPAEIIADYDPHGSATRKRWPGSGEGGLEPRAYWDWHIAY